MKLWLSSVADGSRDGFLVISHEDGNRFVRNVGRHATLLGALDDWQGFLDSLPSAEAPIGLGAAMFTRSEVIRSGPALRRMYQALYASAFGNRSVRVAQTAAATTADDVRGQALLMYQGASDLFLGPGEDFDLADPEAELDLEPEIAVIVGDVPQGTAATDAHRYVRLVVLLNDFTYRAIIKSERATCFGFIQGKPVSSMAPLALTPNALGACWKDGVLHARALVTRNGESFGTIPTNEMQSNFFELIEHASATRALAAGTLISSGTVNSAKAQGAASIVETRALDRARGSQLTTFLQDGDEVAIDVVDAEGNSLFGKLVNRVRYCSRL